MTAGLSAAACSRRTGRKAVETRFDRRDKEVASLGMISASLRYGRGSGQMSRSVASRFTRYFRTRFAFADLDDQTISPLARRG